MPSTPAGKPSQPVGNPSGTLREPFQSPPDLYWALKGRKRPKRAFFGPSKAHFGCFQCYWGLFCLFSGLSDSAKLFFGSPFYSPVLKKNSGRKKKLTFFFEKKSLSCRKKNCRMTTEGVLSSNDNRGVRTPKKIGQNRKNGT